MRMACIFRDFGTFTAHAVEEVGIEDTNGWFRNCGYE
jgi:hypothetical protein